MVPTKQATKMTQHPIPSAKELRTKYTPMSNVKNITKEQYSILQRGVQLLANELMNNTYCGYVAVAEDHSTYTPAMVDHLDCLGYKVAFTTRTMINGTTYSYTDLSFKK